MPDQPGSFRLSSAHRKGPQENPTLVISVFAVVAIIVLVVVFSVQDEDQPPTTPTATPTALPDLPQVATPTPTERIERNQSRWVDAEVILPPTPTPTMPPLEAYPTRRPKPTPSISECAGYRWTTYQVFAPSAQVKVDIQVDNRCPYDLGPSNLLFEITGWRDGARVQSVRGVPFETIRRGRSGDLSIGLPGSRDWYHEIEVVVFD